MKTKLVSKPGAAIEVHTIEVPQHIKDSIRRNMLPWWKKDRFGWPIESIKGQRFNSFMRIICQNIRKITG